MIHSSITLEIPVAIIIYNRPEKVRELLESLSKVRPKKIYVIADGPKVDIQDENIKVNQTRELIDLINWNCEVLKNYSDINLGLAKRVVSGLDWLFEKEDKAIILEDDCIANISFYKFCDFNLTKYENNNRIQMISGSNLYQNYSKEFNEDYFFIQSSLIWGWATWKRTWIDYKCHNQIWNSKKSRLKLIFKYYLLTQSILSTINFYRKLKKVYSGGIDTWDYQLQNLAIYFDKLCIVPKKNMVINIGFDGSGTNYTSSANATEKKKIPTFDLSQLNSNDEVKINRKITRIHLLDSFPKIRPFYYLYKFFLKLVKF